MKIDYKTLNKFIPLKINKKRKLKIVKVSIYERFSHHLELKTKMTKIAFFILKILILFYFYKFEILFPKFHS